MYIYVYTCIIYTQTRVSILYVHGGVGQKRKKGELVTRVHGAGKFCARVHAANAVPLIFTRVFTPFHADTDGQTPRRAHSNTSPAGLSRPAVIVDRVITVCT